MNVLPPILIGIITLEGAPRYLFNPSMPGPLTPLGSWLIRGHGVRPPQTMPAARFQSGGERPVMKS
jgi:hypothetical protein